MNIKDYTLKVSYKCDGGKPVNIEADDSVLKFIQTVTDKSVRISVKASKKVEMISAELIYDRYFENNERIFCNGYQSWTTSREYKKGDTQFGLRGFSRVPFIGQFSARSGDYAFTEYGKDLFHSHTYTYFDNNDGGIDFFGTLNDRTGFTVFYSDVRENVFAITKDVEGLVFEGEYNLFDIIYLTGKYDSVFDKYFVAFPAKKTNRVAHMSGYTSWYDYFQDINEDIILRDLKGITRIGAGANIFQIDDGFEDMIGDWGVDSKKFPNGLRCISDAIHGKNLKAGLWLAPFAAQYKAKVVKEHPEWLLRSKKGKLLNGGYNWGGFYVLNIDIPEVRAHIKNVFDNTFDKWDFDMVKLDFLYATCIEPRCGKTRGQLMHEGMDFLRECCRDKILLGCGVPLVAAFGIADACRIGCDVGLRFKDSVNNYTAGQENVSARLAITNSIFRRHLDGRIFANDPDVFFLRDDGARKVQYNLTQKKFLAKINHMFGSVLFVSDNIGTYDDEKMQILKDSYKKFEGKILDAVYTDVDKITVTYLDGGKKYLFSFNLSTGENTTVEA